MAEVAAIRRTEHLFKPGVSGNPSGRPKALAGLQKEVFEVGAPMVRPLMERLYALAMDDRGGKTAVAAADVLLTRILGRPKPMEDAESDPSRLTDAQLWQRLLSRDDVKAVVMAVLKGEP